MEAKPTWLSPPPIPDWLPKTKEAGDNMDTIYTPIVVWLPNVADQDELEREGANLSGHYPEAIIELRSQNNKVYDEIVKES